MFIPLVFHCLISSLSHVCETNIKQLPYLHFLFGNFVFFFCAGSNFPVLIVSVAGQDFVNKGRGLLAVTKEKYVNAKFEFELAIVFREKKRKKRLHFGRFLEHFSEFVLLSVSRSMFSGISAFRNVRVRLLDCQY